MWDHKGRSIAHPREYFITGFDPATGRRVAPWVSADTAAAAAAAGATDLYSWLETQPAYQDQSRALVPNPDQLASGRIPLDCRYLDFAPQCDGWHQLVSQGGHGSFQIFWSGLWKLTTAAAIPYHTGQYADSSTGFGFVTIGANIGAFNRSAALASKTLTDTLAETRSQLAKQITSIGTSINRSLLQFNTMLMQAGLVMLVILGLLGAVTASRIRRRLADLRGGTTALAEGRFDTRLPVTGKDEITALGRAFNALAGALAASRQQLNDSNAALEQKVRERTDELYQANRNISDSITYASRIQRSLLPTVERMQQHLGTTALTWQPKDVVGGDFYWIGDFGDRDLLVVMDCTGHGVPGAFMTMVATSVLENISAASQHSPAIEKPSPEKAANKKAASGRPDTTQLPAMTAALMMQHLDAGLSIMLDRNQESRGGIDGLECAILSIPHGAGEIEFCGARTDLFTISPVDDGEVTNEAPPFQVRRYRGNRFALGYGQHEDIAKAETTSHAIDGRTCFVIATDGITTQIGSRNKRAFGNARLAETLAAAATNSPSSLVKAVQRALRRWQGSEERRDDLTLLAFRPEP